MMWFRYRWVPVFTRGLCVRIVRGGDDIKELSSEINELFKQPLSIAIGNGITSKLTEIVDTLDDMVFAVGALLFRQEKDLIRFCRRVEDAAEMLTAKAREKKEEYKNYAENIENTIKKLKEKKQPIPFELGKELEGRKAALAEDDKRKKEAIALLQKLIGFIKEADSKITDMRLEAKAQKRGIANIYTLEENAAFRSIFRLGKVTKGRGIRISSAIKGIRNKIDYFSSIVGTKHEIGSKEIEQLIEYCRMELNDLRHLFLFVMQTARKAEIRLNLVERVVLANPKMAQLKENVDSAKGRLGTLRGDIETQYKRLSNEFKKGNFSVSADLQREIKAA